MIVSIVISSLFALFFGGALEIAPERLIYAELIEKISSELPKDDKKKAKKLNKNFKKFSKRYEEEHIITVKKFWNIDADFKSDENSYSEIMKEHQINYDEMITNLLDARDSIKANLTPQQWENAYRKVEKHEKKVWKKQQKKQDE